MIDGKEGRKEEGTEREQVPGGSPKAALVRLCLFCVCVAAALLLTYVTPLGRYLSREQISRFAGELGWAGPTVIIVSGAVMPLLFLPRWPIALVSGLLYGILWGTVLANVASTLGAYLNFLLAHSLLAPGADRLKKRWNLTAAAIPPRQAFVILFLLRAFPLSNFVATNLLAGALRIPLWTYLWATFLGMIPSSFMYAAWGKLLKKPSSEFYFVAVFTFGMIVGGTLLAHRYVRPFLKRLRGTDASGN